MSEYEHYVPDPTKRYPLEMEPAGAAIFDKLDQSAKDDLVLCIRHKLEIDVPDSFILKRLAGQEIPVYFVDPSLLISDEGRPFRTADVKKYGALLSEDLLSMPPVVIDSDNIEGPLCEGGNRTVAAIKEGLPAIYAIDVAKVYMTKKREIRFPSES